MALPPPHPSLVAAFEQASNDAQVPTTRAAAEQTLASLTSHPDSISLSFAILQSSTSPVARFHAAKALQSAADQRWQSLSPQFRYHQSSLRHSLINLVISKPQLQRFDRTAILRTVAFLTRRAYLEEDSQSRNDFFSLLCHSACSPHSPPYTSFIAILLIDLIIDEFTSTSVSLSNSSSINREVFVRARQLFSSPQGHLLPLFTASVRLLSLLTTSLPPQSYSSVPFSTRAIPALSVIHRVFTTDFRAVPLPVIPDNPSTFDPNSTSLSTDALETVVINTFNTPDWQPLISQISLVLDLSFSILAALIAAPDLALNSDSDLISNPLHIITAIAAISHGSYPSPQSASQTLSAIVTGLNQQQWSLSPLGPVRLAYAEVWRRLSCAHGLNNVQRQHTNFILSFTNDTCRQMDALATKSLASDPDDDEFSMDVIDLLLETWANLALQGDDGSSMSEHPLSASIEQVILHFMNMSLRTVSDPSSNTLVSDSGIAPDAEEDLGLDDSSVDDSRLSVAAILTRFVLDKIVPDLSQFLIQAADRVFNWPRGHSSVNGLPLDLYQEDLFFLIRLTCAVLTDEAKGEYPSVPTQFIIIPQDPGANIPLKPQMHARTLLTAVFDVAEKESRMLIERGVHCDEASPRVGAALLNGLGRIARTYLVPLNTSNETGTFAAAGGQSLVETGRNCCFIKIMEGLTQRGFEGDVADTAASLMSSLALASETHRELIEAPIWQQLLRVGVGAFQTLPPKAVRDVGRSLTLILGDVVVEQLLIPAYTCLQTFARSQEDVADAADRVIATLNLISGTASCYRMGIRTRQTLIACLKTPDGVAALCAKNFGRIRPDVSRMVVRLADDVLYGSLALIDQNDGRDLLQNLMSLLKIHSDIIRSHLADLSLDELGTNAEDVLMLLTHMLDEEGEADVAEACFYGLSTLLPVMNESVLEIPSVNACFFRFVTSLVCSHAEKLTSIPSDLCAKILQSIDMQRASFDASLERKALEAITALARARLTAHHHQNQDNINHENHFCNDQNQNFFQSKKSSFLSPSDSVYTNSDSGSAIVDGALGQFLLRIFEAIANGSAHTANLDAAADALLPLAHVQIDTGHGKSVSAFEQVGSALVTSTGNNADLRDAVIKLAHVASEAGLAYGFHDGTTCADRAAILRATKQFREAVAKFSIEARNCLVSEAITGKSPS